MTLDEFERKVTTACAASPIVQGLAVIGSGITWLRLRAYLQGNAYIEAFFNEKTGKTSYAMIRDDQRIFGADNTNKWHWHPFDSPIIHESTTGEISFEEFLAQIEFWFDRNKA